MLLGCFLHPGRNPTPQQSPLNVLCLHGYPAWVFCTDGAIRHAVFICVCFRVIPRGQMRCPVGCLPSRKLCLTGLPGPFTEDRWCGYYVRVTALPRPLHSLDACKQFFSSFCVPGAVCTYMRQVRESMFSGSSRDPESLRDVSARLCKVRHLCSKIQSRAQGKGESQNAKRKKGFAGVVP